VRSAGVPRMVARPTVGQPGSRAESWQMILREADIQGRKAGMGKILFGGWGIDPRARASTDAAFRAVWEQRRQELAAGADDIAHEQWRVGALIAFAALLRWHRKHRAIRWLRVIALAVIAAGLALTIAKIAQWLGATVSASAAVVFLCKCVIALCVGAAIEKVVKFNPKEEVQDDPVEKPA